MPVPDLYRTVCILDVYSGDKVPPSPSSRLHYQHFCMKSVQELTVIDGAAAINNCPAAAVILGYAEYVMDAGGRIVYY